MPRCLEEGRAGVRLAGADARREPALLLAHGGEALAEDDGLSAWSGSCGRFGGFGARKVHVFARQFQTSPQRPGALPAMSTMWTPELLWGVV